jgi:hypothetical protein
LDRNGTSAPAFRLDFLNNINDYLDYEHSGNIHHVEFHLRLYFHIVHGSPSPSSV